VITVGPNSFQLFIYFYQSNVFEDLQTFITHILSCIVSCEYEHYVRNMFDVGDLPVRKWRSVWPEWLSGLLKHFLRFFKIQKRLFTCFELLHTFTRTLVVGGPSLSATHTHHTPLRRGALYCDERVCLSVSLSVSMFVLEHFGTTDWPNYAN